MSSTTPMRFLVSALVIACAGIFFTGCKKDSSSTGPGGGGAGSVVNVAGKVIGQNRQPVSGVPVLVTGKPSVNTDANGAFAIANVTTPYDITIVNAAQKAAYIYRGVSRSDPTLLFLGSSAGTPNTALVSGKIHPASAFPEPAGRRTYIAFVSTEAVSAIQADGSVSPATYSLAPSWYGATTITGTLHSLQWDGDASGLPTTYQRYGARSGVSLTAGGTFANVNDTMSITPATVTLSGSVSVPAGYTLGWKFIHAEFGNRMTFPLAAESNNSTTFSFKTPDISGMTIHVEAAGGKPSGGASYVYKSGVATNSTNALLTLPAAPELSLPVDGATGVRTGSPFSWNAFAGGIQVLAFDGPSGQPDFYVMTMAANDSLPNLSTAGLPVSGSTAYSWRVVGIAPFASMDAATGSSGFLPQDMGGLLIEGTGSIGQSVPRTFTIAP